LRDELDDIRFLVDDGCVTRGGGDRRSDIDLWVLVREDKMGTSSGRTTSGNPSERTRSMATAMPSGLMSKICKRFRTALAKTDVRDIVRGGKPER